MTQREINIRKSVSNRLKAFLKSKRSYEIFIENTTKYSSRSWEQRLPLSISNAFIWSDSDEGYYYWRQLSYEFEARKDGFKSLKELKKGDFFKVVDSIGANVWVRGEYVRSEKRYSCYKFDDVNHECLYKGDRLVFTNFEF